MLPQTCSRNRARRPSEANNVSHIHEIAPVKAVDASPKLASLKADVAADTVKEVAISADSVAVATPVAAVSSKHSRAHHTMHL